MKVNASVSLLCRSQMQTIITKACKELGITPIPSKRVCVISLTWQLGEGAKDGFHIFRIMEYV